MTKHLQSILFPLTLPYYLGYLAHRALVKPKKMPRPVISVGNVTWGGAGKTPAVIMLARDFMSAGKKVAVLTRGYARKAAAAGREPLCVSDGKSIKVGPEEAGDEPYLMAEKISGAVILVGKNRAASAAEAVEIFGADVLILDDGFQHWGVSRDLDIVCVNALDPFGNGMLIPAGILREPLAPALARAGLIMLTNIDKISDGDARALKAKISSLSAAPVVTAGYRAAGIKNVFTGAIVDAAATGEVAGFSGLADNRGFEAALNSLGFNVGRFYSFPDHKWYAETDIAKMADENPAAIFVTTMKDAVRFRGFGNLPKERFFYLDVEVEIVEGESAWREKLKPLF